MMGVFAEGWPLAVGAVAVLVFLAWWSLVGPKLSPLQLRRSAFRILGVGLMLLALGTYFAISSDAPDTWLHAWSFLLVRLGLVLSLGCVVQFWRARKIN